MLKSLGLRDFVIVDALDLAFDAGFTVLTGETGAGKSILVDALQLALGERADASVVREGCARAEVAAVFDPTPATGAWLEAAGFAADDGDGGLLLRRVVDAQGRSRAWINGGSATVTQLRELAEHLVDIHGQHAWQGLTRPAAVRALVDGLAGSDTATLAAAWDRWREAEAALDAATRRRAELDAERERLAFELRDIDRLDPRPGEWESLEAEHQRLGHAQSLIDASQAALALLDDDEAAGSLAGKAVTALQAVVGYDARLQPVLDVLTGAQAQLEDAARSLSAYLRHADVDPARLAALDDRLAAWLSAARRQRCTPADLPHWVVDARERLRALDAAVDDAALAKAAADARRAYDRAADAVSARRRACAPALARAVTDALQTLGMAGARFEVDLAALPQPQRHGRESIEFLVAGHAGTTPRPLAKVASGGELSRIALAIAVSVRAGAAEGGRAASIAPAVEPATVVFDEVDSGIGGAVADTVGALMARLGTTRQVLAVTHLAQVAAHAHRHLRVSKATHDGRTVSRLEPVADDARVTEVARMLGGDARSATSRAHAAELLDRARAAPAASPPPAPRRAGGSPRSNAPAGAGR